MERMQAAVILLLKLGMGIALGLVSIGGISFLLQHGNDIINYQVFHGASFEVTSVRDILSAASSLTPYALMELGILILIITQIVRIAVVGWYFSKMRDYSFSIISLLVLVGVIVIAFGIW